MTLFPLGKRVIEKYALEREKDFQLVKEASLARGVIVSLRLAELLEQLFLFIGKPDGGFDDDLDQQIALALAVHIGSAFIFHAEDFAVLGPFGDGDAAGTSKRSGQLFFASEGCFREADRKFDDHVVAFALEDRVGLDGDEDVKISCGAALFSHVAVA